ncbi:hypothetical protein STEG23_028971, partial [Scotinomys teguina]
MSSRGPIRASLAAPTASRVTQISPELPLSPWWPTVVAEGEGQGPLLRVDMSIAEACQKSKRESMVGIGHVGVKVGRDDAESSQTGDKDEEGIKNHASDGRQKIQDLERPGQEEHYLGNSSGNQEEGALLSATTTAKPLLDNKVGKNDHQTFITPGLSTYYSLSGNSPLYSMVYMYHIFLIHSSVEGHLGCFQVLAITNNAATNIVEHVSL